MNLVHSFKFLRPIKKKSLLLSLLHGNHAMIGFHWHWFLKSNGYYNPLVEYVSKAGKFAGLGWAQDMHFQ